jgi:hypothetical protein
MPNTSLLLLILLLQLKHFICDGPLQTKAIVDGKSVYGNRLGLLHAGLHGLGTFAAFQWVTVDWKLALALAVADTLIHYHVDFIKENIVKIKGWTTANAKFWWALTADQFAHNVTYIALVAICAAMV